MANKDPTSLDITIRSRKERPALGAPLLVRDWSFSHAHGVPTVGASIDDFHVYFSGPALANMPERADAFLTISLLPAMYQGRPLDLTALPPVSAGLLANIEHVQEIWACWNPCLRRVPVLAREEATPAGDGALTFFSGGVDAVHSVLHLGERAGRLVMINGFDFMMNEADFTIVRKRVGKLAARLGHELQTIETNWINMTRHHRIARSTSHGAALAAVGHLMHPEAIHISSSRSWAALFPSGNHPLVDPHWSSDSVRVVHVGNDSPRVEKIARISRQPELLKLLWICHEDLLTNCGKCAKCLRTRAMLSLLDADTSAFPPSDGDALEPWLEMLAKGNEMVYLNEVTEAIRRTRRDDVLPRLMRSQRAALRRDVARRLWRKLLPGLARKRDSALDLLPWGRGPRPEL